MPRQPRYAISSMPQHVIQRGNNRVATFFAEQDYLFYLECLKEASSHHATRVHAYVLMTNHVHLLMTPDFANGIPKVMQSVGRRYVRHINDTYQRTGTLWEGRYKASLVDSETYLLTCYRYIERNPVRAGMVRSPSDYRWSSYGHHIGNGMDSLINDHAVYLALGQSATERYAAYRSLCEQDLDESSLSSIRATTNQCLVLGTEGFKDDIEQILARGVRHGHAGRPPREIAV